MQRNDEFFDAKHYIGAEPRGGCGVSATSARSPPRPFPGVPKAGIRERSQVR
jgi:hypothetical protein